MSEAQLLIKIHEDLETLKRDVAAIKSSIHLEPPLIGDVKRKVKEARERIAKGKFVSNDEILKEFDLA
ncbi:hypothetical protein HYU14_00660 [Candidatus Woesearchaeota archaeon]|nr:hypothetical protein [Candidatus Woesearchaeota archaeon]